MNSCFFYIGECTDNAIKANEDDCSSYLICNHGSYSRVPCPAGLQFNAKLSICDWQENSDCAPTPVTNGEPSTTQTNFKPLPTTGSPIENEVDLGDSIPFAPYVDLTLPETNLSQIMKETGQKDFTLAFALGSFEGCVPRWGAEKDLDDPNILDGIRAVQSNGGRMIVALGGAVGPYLEHLCTTEDDLVKAYKYILDTVKTTHLDLDVEAPINLDLVNAALAKLQMERPTTTVSYTLMVQAEDYGLNPDLGLRTIQNAKAKGVKVHIVNGMTMEYGASSPDWGDAVIGAGKSILKQMGTIWPEKSERELKLMLGITPMIGRNFNGKVFQPEHGRKVVNWANANKIGFLSFWSVGRDNGQCPNGPIKPTCSSTTQNEYEFTTTFQNFRKL